MTQADIEELVDLDPQSPVPPFEQLKEQIAAAIESGNLLPADRLPPVRQLANDLGLAANTVARSYRELERAGLFETRGRHGTFVATSPSPTRKLRGAEARLVRHLHELGIGNEEILAMVRREADRHHTTQHRDHRDRRDSASARGFAGAATEVVTTSRAETPPPVGAVDRLPGGLGRRGPRGSNVWRPGGAYTI